MSEYRFDVKNLSVKTNISSQPVLIAANIENSQITDPIHGVEGRFEFSPMSKPVFLNDPSPALQALFSLRMKGCKSAQGAITD